MKNIEPNDETRVAEALEAMRAEAGRRFSLATVNLAELERRTGISRAKLRRMKQNGFNVLPHANKGRKSEHTILTGYNGMLDTRLSSGIANSSVCFERLQEAGYCGGLTAVKTYISQHRNLIPAPRHLVAPQGNRGRRLARGLRDIYAQPGFSDEIVQAPTPLHQRESRMVGPLAIIVQARLAKIFRPNLVKIARPDVAKISRR